MQVIPFDIQEADQVHHGLFVERPEHLSYEVVADELYNQYRSDLSVASMIVVRPPVDNPFRKESVKVEELKPLFQRAPHVPTYILGSWRFRHFLTGNLNTSISGNLPPGGQDAFIAQLRDFELKHYALHSNALLRTTGTRVFRAPSGKYTRTFIRVGNVQINRSALDGFFFWLLPWMKNTRATVTETWTISSIALNACRLVSRYARSTHGSCEIDMLSRYHDGSLELVPDTLEVLKRVSRSDGRILVLISSSMSGTVVARIKETIKRLHLDVSRFEFCALYNLGDGKGLPSLCDLSKGIAGSKFQYFDAPPPDAGETPVIVDIDKRTYFPLRVEEAPVLLRKSTADLSYKFFEDYAGSGLFSVHRDSYLLNRQRFRHHAIFTDLLNIIDREPFSSKYRDVVLKMDLPGLIICPPHSAGVAMAEIANALFASKYGTRVDVFQHLDLNASNTPDSADAAFFERIRRLNTGESIMILDDVSVSGRRLSRYQLSLRELGFTGRIHNLVGIARPKRRAEWEIRVKQLTLRQPRTHPQHTVNAIEFVVLPDWDEDRCPWCREREIYRKLAVNHAPLPLSLVARANRLQQAIDLNAFDQGIYFIQQRDPPMKLTMNSIFAPQAASEADVFASVASALQEMRTNRANKESLEARYPEVPVISVENYLGGQFTDSVLRAAILRASLRSEIEYPTAEAEQARSKNTLDIVFKGDLDVENLTTELLLAVALHKLPKCDLNPGQRQILVDRGMKELFDLFSAAADENC